MALFEAELWLSYLLSHAQEMLLHWKQKPGCIRNPDCLCYLFLCLQEYLPKAVGVFGVFLVDIYEMFRLHQESDSAAMPCRACTWEWLEQGMVRGSVANNFSPGIRQVMLFPCTALSTFPKKRGGRLGYPHQSCELTAVQCGTTDRIHPLHAYRLKHTSRFSFDRVEVCIQLFSIPCKSLPFSLLNQRFFFSSNSFAITVNY